MMSAAVEDGCGDEGREAELEKLAQDIQSLSLEELYIKYSHFEMKNDDLSVFFLSERERDVMFNKGLEAVVNYVTPRNSKTISGKTFVAPKHPEQQSNVSAKKEERVNAPPNKDNAFFEERQRQFRQLDEDMTSLAFSELSRKYFYTKTSHGKVIFCLTSHEAASMHNYDIKFGAEALMATVDQKHVMDLPSNLRSSEQQKNFQKHTINQHGSRSVGQRHVTWMAQFPRSKTVSDSHSQSSCHSSYGKKKSYENNNNRNKDNETDNSYDSDATITADDVASRDSTVCSGHSGYSSAVTIKKEKPIQTATKKENEKMTIKVHNPGDVDIIFSLIEGLTKNNDQSVDWKNLVANSYKLANELPSDKKLDNLLDRMNVLKKRLNDMKTPTSSTKQSVEEVFKANVFDIEPLKHVAQIYFALQEETGNPDDFVHKNVKFDDMQKRRRHILKTAEKRRSKIGDVNYIDDTEMIAAAYDIVGEEQKLFIELYKKLFSDVSPHLSLLKTQLAKNGNAQKMEEGLKAMDPNIKKRFNLAHEFAEIFFKHLDEMKVKQKELNDEVTLMCLEKKSEMVQQSEALRRKNMQNDVQETLALRMKAMRKDDSPSAKSPDDYPP